MRRDGPFSFDFLIFFSALALMVIGVIFIYSSGINSEGVLVTSEYIKQIIWCVIGLAVMIGIFFVDYERTKGFALQLYIILVSVLLFTLVFGAKVNGARSWIGIGEFGGQPSEFMKIAIILFLARFFEVRQKDIKKLSTFVIGFLITALPFGLILLQPDMGTAMVFMPIFLFMAFVAGSRITHIFYILGVGILIIIFSVLPEVDRFFIEGNNPVIQVFVQKESFLLFIAVAAVVTLLGVTGTLIFKRPYYYWIMYSGSIVTIGSALGFLGRSFLKGYQVMRLIVFIDPSVDSRGTGWNIIQSMTAVGSGGFWGKGYLRGTQSHYRYLPQQSTDFIFSIIAEEWGFIGGLVILTLFGVILIRSLMIVYSLKDRYGLFIGVGISAMIFFHVLVNVGMAIGIMPITGIPLFFLSYGGSSLLTALAGIGLMLNIYFRRYRY